MVPASDVDPGPPEPVGGTLAPSSAAGVVAYGAPVQRLPIPRLRSGRPSAAILARLPVAPVSGRPEPAPVGGAYAFGPREIERLARALGRRLGEPRRRIDSPDEIRRALIDALGDRLRTGTVGVTRMPGALQTAESWHITLTLVSPAARDEMDRLAEEARDG